MTGARPDSSDPVDDFFEESPEVPDEPPSTGAVPVIDAPSDSVVDAPSDSVFADPAVVVPPAAPQPQQQQAPLRAGDLPGRERRRRVRLQARRVRRIVRHIEPWSVLKISIIFYLCLWVILMIAGVMVWGVAVSSGTVDKVESFITDLFALEEFTFDSDQIFRGFALTGLILAIAGSAFNVLLCVLFNLISDITGGLRITVIEEESARFRPRPPRRSARPPRPKPPPTSG